MQPQDATAARLDALEIRAMHQDQLIEDLNAALTAQWRVIDDLHRQVARLDERVQDFGKGSGETPERPPPHY